MTITVKAAAGLRVPREGAPRKYIGSDPVTVPASAYYLRRLADGDLVRADGPVGEATAAQGSTRTAKGGKK